MVMKKIATYAAVAGCLAALGGCVADGSDPFSRTRVATGIEGSWRNSEGIYSATFSGLSTEWRDSETGALLIRGSYRQTNQFDYSLVLNSQRTLQTRYANCRLVANVTLNCIYSDGSTFVLRRLS